MMLGFPLPAFAATNNKESNDSQQRDLKEGCGFRVFTAPKQKPVRLNGKTLCRCPRLNSYRSQRWHSHIANKASTFYFAMFRLLRRIRRRLVGEGSFRKYLLYATGEFLLIVGGVLVALSLNNWNIEQQNRQEEQAILSQILGEPRTMNRTVNRIRNGIERKSETLADLEAHFSSQAQIEDPKAFLELVVNAASFGWEQPRVQRTAFTEIVGSGKLGLSGISDCAKV